MEVHDRSEEKRIILLSDLRTPKKESPFEGMNIHEILDEAEMALDSAKALISALRENPVINIDRAGLEVIERKVSNLCAKIVSVEASNFQRTVVMEFSENIGFIINLIDRINREDSQFTIRALKEIKETLEKARAALEESLNVELPEIDQVQSLIISTMGWEK